jgi:hypothetical protein
MPDCAIADCKVKVEEYGTVCHGGKHGRLERHRQGRREARLPARLEEIARLLTKDPALWLLVVGHAGMTGSLEANMKLPQARAESAANAVVSQHGVAAARLRGYGVGPLAPGAGAHPLDLAGDSHYTQRASIQERPRER